MKACPACHFLVPNEASDCTFCGVDVAAVAADAPPPQPESALPPARSETVSTKVVAGVIVAASLLVAGVGWWAFGSTSADDGRVAAGPTTTTASTVPPATTTTLATQLTTTSALPKVGLSGRTTPVGLPGVFSAVMPAGTTSASPETGLTEWSVTLDGGGELQLATFEGIKATARYQNAVGRLDVQKFAAAMNDQLGATGTPPVTGSYGAGPGAEWSIDAGSRQGRITVIDGGTVLYMVVLEDVSALDGRDVASYLAVVGSIQRA